MERTEFLILIQQPGGIIIHFTGNVDIAQWWMETTSNRLENWDFQGIPDMAGIYIVSAEIDDGHGGDIRIRSEQWRLANVRDVRSFGINFADTKEV